MPDTLTERFKKQLEKQGVVATDAQITSYLQQQGLLEPERNQLMPLSNAIQQRGMSYEAPPKVEDKIDLLQGVAAGAWSLFDVAALGIPGLTGLTQEYVQYEKLGPAGRVGRVLGEATGFLVPLKGISAITRSAASLAKGSKAGINRAAEIASKTAGQVGVSKSAAASAIRDVAADKHLRLTQLPRYALKGENLDEVDRVMKSEFARKLGSEFPNMSPQQLGRIADDAVNALRGEARHINSAGQWIERRLATRFPDRDRITTYLADAADMTLNFSLYNILTDATRNMITGSEFTPGHDIWDAMKFSAFLPAIHAIPGGGRRLIATRRNMNDLLKKFRSIDHDTMARQGKTEELNAMLQLLARGTKFEAGVSAQASQYKGRMFSAKEAASHIKSIIKKGNPEISTREFMSEAGRDLVGSFPRMLVGALYFNSNVLLDRDVLRNMPKDEMWTHLFVGAMFTKRHKPLYQEKFPTLNNFDRKLELLRTLGIDADSLGDYARWHNRTDQIGMANVGIRDNAEAMDMVRIFGDRKVKEEANQRLDAIGADGLLNYDLVKQAHEIHDLHQIVSNTIGDAGKKRIDIKNLSVDTIKDIDAKLRSIVINKEGEKLSEDNFHEWKEGFEKGLREGPASIYLGMIASVARHLGIPVDGEPTVDGKLRVGRLEGWQRSDLILDSPELAQWVELRDKFEKWNYLETFEEAIPRTAKDIVTAENKADVFRLIAGELKSVPEAIKKSNYEEGVEGGDILVTDNGFLDSIQNYKTDKRLNSLYRILSSDSRMTSEEQAVHRALSETLGDQIPSQLGKIQELIRIRLTKEEKKETGAKDRRALAEDALHDIAHMWSISKSDGRKRIELSLRQAESLIGTMEAEGLLFERNMYRHDAYEQVNKHFWRRIIASPDIGAKELGVIRIGIDSGLVGVTVAGGGRPRLEWPHRTAMAEALARELKTDISDPEVVELLEQYDVILSNITSIKGKYIDTGTRFIDPGSMPEQGYSGFIHDAYILTEKYDRIVTDKVRQLNNVFSKNATINVQIKSLIEMFKNEKGEFKDIEAGEIEEIQKKLEVIVNDPEIIKALDKEQMGLIKALKSKFGIDKSMGAEADSYSSAAEGIESMINSLFKDNSRFRRVANDLIYNVSAGSKAQVRGAERLDKLTALLVSDLKDMKIELNQEKKIGLEDIHEQFVKAGKLEKYLNHLEIAAAAWGKDYTESQWMEYSREIRQRENDASSLGIDSSEKFSIQYVPSKYGVHNDKLTENNFRNTLDHLRMLRDEASATYEKTGSTRLWDSFEEAGQELINEVRKAIVKKNKATPEEVDAEFSKFLKEALNPLLSNVAGMEKMPTMSLEQGSNGKPILQLNETLSGSGELSRFIAEAADLKGGEEHIGIFRLRKNGVYNNRKVNIRESLDNFDSIINNIEGSNIQIAAELIPRETSDRYRPNKYSGAEDPISKGISVATGLSNQLWVRTDNLTDGRLNRWFKRWYDGKVSSLENIRDTGTSKEASDARIVLTRLETLYKSFAEKTDSTDPAVRNMVKAMYWDRVSPELFNKMVRALDKPNKVDELGAAYMKYMSLAEATGAKVQGKYEVIRAMLKLNPEIPAEQRASLESYIKRPELRQSVIADEAMAQLNAGAISKSALNKLKKKYPESADMIDSMVGELKTYFKSLDSSAINAQSWLSTRAAHILYAFKGRSLGDNLAGIKPSGAFRGDEGSMLLKSNFVYDPKIANMMDKLGLDILSTESAAKVFTLANKVNIEGKFGSTGEMSDRFFERYGSKDSFLDSGEFGTIKVENIYLGKVTDRKGATSISYALMDFLSSNGMNDMLKEGGYFDYASIAAQGVSNLHNISMGGSKSMGLSMSLIHEARESGEIFDRSQSGLVEYLLNFGLDPDSGVINTSLQRMAVKRLMKDFKSPSTEGSSYSILKPFIQGQPSVYAEVEGPRGKFRRQIVYGEKRLPHEDKAIVLSNMNNVKYVVTIKGKDIQVGMNDKGKYEFIDNLESNRKYTDTIRAKKIVSVIEKIKDRVNKDFNGRPPTLYEFHQYLKQGNLIQELMPGKYEPMEVSLSSLTLRMPNLGGDVAVHKIEGFYSPREGNVVGVNPLDLASVHQGDFDVDAAFNYHDVPWALNKAHSKNLGLAVDAITYPGDRYDMDVFENGYKTDKPAGTGGTSLADGMQMHLKNYENSKKVFGSIKRLSSAISSLERINLSASKFGIIQKDSLEYAQWLQRYKNTLQSIIDATKRPNFVSRAKVDDILEWVLFGEMSRLGHDYIPKELREGAEKWHEQGISEGYFKLDKNLSPTERAMYKESIIEMVKMLGRPQKILSGVFDESGRRPPEIRDINSMYSDMQKFFNKPQSWIANRILIKHSGNEAFRNAILKEFYGISEASEYKDTKSFFTDYFSKNKRTPEALADVFSFGVKSDIAIMSTPGGRIAREIVGQQESLKILKKNYGKWDTSNLQDRVGAALTDLEEYAAIVGEKEFRNTFTEMVSGGDLAADAIAGDKLRSLSTIFSRDGERFLTSHKDVQEYSVVAHILENELSSLQGFIKRNTSPRGTTDSVDRAQFKMKLIKSIIDGIDRKEHRIIGGLGKKETGKEIRKHFHFIDKNWSKEKKSRPYRNDSRNPQYVYREVDRSGKKSFKLAKVVRPSATSWLRPGKYVILKNPIRYTPVNRREIVDAYSLLEAVGETIPRFIHGMEEHMIPEFYNDTGEMRKELGTLAHDVYEQSKNSPYSRENWMLESKLEDKIVNDFFEKWLPRLTKSVDGRMLDYEPSEIVVWQLAAELMKPRPIAGGVAYTSGTAKIHLPEFKINKRMVSATFRYLKDAGYSDIAKDIAGKYGRAYRRRMHSVIPIEEESMYVSNLYNEKIMLRDKNPLVELAFGKGYLYSPALMHRIRGDIRGRNPKEYWKRDINGNFSRIVDYGNWQDIGSEFDYYLDRNRLKKEENKKYECE